MPQKTEIYYKYTLDDKKKQRADGSYIQEEGGPATWEKLEQILTDHYGSPYLAESEIDGEWIIYRSEDEASDPENAVGKAIEV
jgi:hypothetical protein